MYYSKISWGQALAELLAGNPPINSFATNAHVAETQPSLSPEWTLYFDGSATGCRGGARTGGAGIVIVAPTGKLHLYAFTFTFYCTNNQAKDDALVLGL